MFSILDTNLTIYVCKIKEFLNIFQRVKSKWLDCMYTLFVNDIKEEFNDSEVNVMNFINFN